MLLLTRMSTKRKWKQTFQIVQNLKKFTFKEHLNHLNFILNKEKRLREIIKPLYEKDCSTKGEYLKICPNQSKLGILYGQATIHKPVENNCPSFGLILYPVNFLFLF